MSTLPLPAIEVVSVQRAVPLNGSPSSQDYNDDQNNALIDLTTISSFINATLIPLLQVLPSLAATFGLEGRAVNTDTSDLSPLCFNAKTATPLTVAQSIKYLQSVIQSQQGLIQSLSTQVAALQSQLSSTNQNGISLTLQNYQSAMNNIVAQITAMQTEISVLQNGGV